MRARDRILAGLIAFIVCVNGVWCACAAAAPHAATQPTEPPCCQHHPKPDDNHPASPDCPHCKQTQVSADPAPAAPTHLAPLPIAAVFEQIAFRPIRPAVLRRMTPAEPLPASGILPLRLHCALTL